MAKYVKFGRGAAARYNSATMDGLIYFATDTKQIHLDGVTYGYSTSDSSKLEGSITSIELGADQKTLTITKNDGSTATVVLLEATQEKSGLMSADDKKKLDTLAGGAETEGSVAKQVADAKSELEDKISKATVASADKTITVSASDSGTDLKVNIDGETIVKDSDGKLSVASKALTVEGEAAIEVEDGATGKTVKLNIASTEKVLSQSGSGLATTLKLDYVKDDKKVYLKGIDDDVISEIDATDFVADGFLDSVAYSTESGEENILVFTWNTTAGKTATKIDLSKYIDTYLAGDGLALDSATKTFSVKVKENDKYFEVTEDGVASKGIDEAIEAAIEEALGGEDAKPVNEQIEDAINALDSEVTSTDGTNVQVKVTQVDGKISAVSVPTDNTASKTELAAEVTARKAVTGVDADTYAPKADAHFIQAATSLKDADEKLDAALYELADALTWHEEN